MIFNTEYKLPGLFNKNLYNSAINGSLWSLHYEIECYFFLMCSFLLFRNKKLILNIIFGIILIDTILPSRMIFHALGSSPEIYYLPFSFAYGVFLAVNQTEIRINRMLVIFSFLTCFIFRNTGYQELFLIIASCNLIVFVASRKFVLGIKPKYDISYGIYLWGFLIQQVVYFTLGQVYAGLHFAIALILSVIIAYISFVFVEKPFMNLGKQAIRFCKLKNDDFLKKYSFRINS
jgi:peptidoglycan/LPS O-acetylase OafA/YrhL